MKQKITLLILICVLTITALAVIQGYFIYNTYKLQEREVKSLVTQELLDIETSGKLDSINKSWMIKTGRFINDYTQGRATKEDYALLIKKTADSLSPVMSDYIKHKKLVGDYDVTYSNYVKVVRLQDQSSKVIDTLYKGKLKLFSNNITNAEETEASESRWRESTTATPESPGTYDFEIVTSRYYSISNWERQVLYKMSGLLLFSVGLLAMVIGLFYWSIKNLISQKKIADVKTDFINNITHEFQTPIAALTIAVATLKKKDTGLSEEQFYNSLSIIDRQNQRMQKLFAQISDASVGAGQIDISGATHINTEYIQQAIADFSISHPQAVISFSGNPSAVLYMDSFHFTTLLNNLLDNSVKYGADTIEVIFEQSALGSAVYIKDNGRGIPPEHQAAIFDKFYRIDTGNVHNTKGLGLGLFYVKQIITAYHGKISVSSDEGKGSIFTLSLPIA